MPQWSNPLGTLQQQYGSPHLLRLDAGGLPYRPSTVMRRERDRQRGNMRDIRRMYLAKLMEHRFKNAGKNAVPTLQQILQGWP